MRSAAPLIDGFRRAISRFPGAWGTCVVDDREAVCARLEGGRNVIGPDSSDGDSWFHLKRTPYRRFLRRKVTSRGQRGDRGVRS